MSTTDPAAAREAKRARMTGSPLALLETLIGGLLLAVTGGAMGYGLAGIFDLFRSTAATAAHPDGQVAVRSVIIIGAALLVGIVAGVIYASSNKSFSGRHSGLVGPSSPTLFLLGLSAALWLISLQNWAPRSTAAGQPLPPPGFPADCCATDGSPLGTGTLAYTTPNPFWDTMYWWLPGAFTALLVLSALLTWRSRRRRAQAESMRDHLLQHGQRNQGVVTESTLTLNAESRNTLVKWTFTYRDAAGQERWVLRHGYFPRGKEPRPGTPVWVIYDPEHPGDFKRIFASFTDSRSPEDFRN